tara:strand:- start:414 stop:1523 length:1110 start_codon:yes stop_codon:yes gene_type:complete
VTFLPISESYQSSVEHQLKSSSAPNIVQVRESQAGQWLTSGLFSALDSQQTFTDLVNRMGPSARAGIIAGKIPVGLPYYSDVMMLAYNPQMLEAVDVHPPKTWEELRAYALQIRNAGLSKTPLTLNFSPKVNSNLPWWGMVYAAEGRMRSPNDDLIDINPESPEARLLKIIRLMLVDDFTLDPNLGDTSYSAIADGKHAFTIVGSHMAARFNDQNTLNSTRIEFTLLPGLDTPGEFTVGWTPFYAMTSQNIDVYDSALLTLHLGGIDSSGEFFSPRKWALEAGLPPAYPEILSHKDVKNRFNSIIDLTTLKQALGAGRPVEALWEPWYRAWEHHMQEEILLAVWGRKNEVDCLQSINEFGHALARRNRQ